MEVVAVFRFRTLHAHIFLRPKKSVYLFSMQKIKLGVKQQSTQDEGIRTHIIFVHIIPLRSLSLACSLSLPVSDKEKMRIYIFYCAPTKI